MSERAANSVESAPWRLSENWATALRHPCIKRLRLPCRLNERKFWQTPRAPTHSFPRSLARLLTCVLPASALFHLTARKRKRDSAGWKSTCASCARWIIDGGGFFCSAEPPLDLRSSSAPPARSDLCVLHTNTLGIAFFFCLVRGGFAPACEQERLCQRASRKPLCSVRSSLFQFQVDGVF